MIPNIPDDILYAAGRVVADITEDTSMTLMGEVDRMAQPIARAILAERETQQKRAADILSAVADILAKRMTDLATPELLEALSAAIRPDNAGKPHG